MDARGFAFFDGFPGGLDLVRFEAGERADLHISQLFREELHCLEIARRCPRKAGLKNVDAEPFQLLAKIQLLFYRQRPACRLLAVAQRCIEDL